MWSAKFLLNFSFCLGTPEEGFQEDGCKWRWSSDIERISIVRWDEEGTTGSIYRAL